MEDTKEAKKIYDKLAEFYHTKRLKREDWNALIEQPTSFSLLGDVKRKKVLDAGCGSGIYTKILAKKGAKVCALDLSSKMLKLAKEHCKNYKIEFKQGSIDKLPYPKNKFDAILASLVIHYLKKPEKAFKEFNRVLKKNGILVFSTHHPIMESWRDVKTIKSKIKRTKDKNVMVLSDYFKKGKYYWKLHKSEVKVPAYRFGFERLFDILYKTGFIVEKFKEPYIRKNQKKLKRFHKRFIEVPTFIVLKCRKRG